MKIRRHLFQRNILIIKLKKELLDFENRESKIQSTESYSKESSGINWNSEKATIPGRGKSERKKEKKKLSE
jgi:hypothetical protein